MTSLGGSFGSGLLECSKGYYVLLTQSEFDIEESFVFLQLGRLEGEQNLGIVLAEDFLHAQKVELEALEATASCRERGCNIINI